MSRWFGCGVVIAVQALGACGGDSGATPDAAPMYSVSVGFAGGGSGTITSSAAGITCGADCAESYAAGTQVTLTAVAADGSTFAGWSGGGCSGTAPCTVTADADVTVTAMMVPDHTLVVIPEGAGTGTVTSSPAGIDCGADCTEAFAPGTSVTLTATPTGSSMFLGWGGACTGTASTCTVTADDALGVVATFGVPQASLTVLKTGTGTGTVTSTSPAIDCGPDCTETAAIGTMVTLSATPGAGAMFSGWSGGGCTGTGPCDVMLDAATTVTASFTLVPYALTVTREGSGSVLSSPAGIDCGSDCSEEFGAGTLVTLVPSPDADSRFVGWTGACSGTGVCAVTIEGAATVGAQFQTNGCDSFFGPDGTTVSGWTERAGDWSLAGGQLSHGESGGAYSHVITKDDSNAGDGCVSLTAHHTGTASVESVGAVLRWSAPDSYVVALVQDNAAAGNFNSAWIYQYPGLSSLGGALVNQNFGTSPRIRACITGTTVTLGVDANGDGTYETTTSGTTSLTSAGLAGVMTLNQNDIARVDDVCWGP